MIFRPRMKITSNYPGYNILTPGCTVNGRKRQFIGPDSPNNDDTEGYNFPPPIYNAHQDIWSITPIT